MAFIVGCLGVLCFILCYGLFFSLLHIGRQRQNAALAAAADMLANIDVEMEPLLGNNNANNNNNNNNNNNGNNDERNAIAESSV